MERSSFSVVFPYSDGYLNFVSVVTNLGPDERKVGALL